MPSIDNYQRGNLNQKNPPHQWNKFYRALVLSAADPRLLGRVKVRIPDIMPETGDEYTLDWSTNGLWAHPANNYMGGRNIQDTQGQRATLTDANYQGSCLIPPAGSWVWIFFENGEPNHPYYFGSLEAGQRKVLPENQQGSEWWKKWTLIKTANGRCIVISDDEDDCRVEICGKKRQLNNAPDGDGDSVYTIDGNMTTILIDERPGHEKLLIKDYRGNFIKMIQDEYDVTDELHMFFQGNIHIETLKSLYIKAGEEIHVNAGTNILISAQNNIDVNAEANITEEAGGNISRSALGNDIRTSTGDMRDTSYAHLSHGSMGDMENGCTGKLTISGDEVHVKSSFGLYVDSGTNTDIRSDGPISINGETTDIQMGAEPAESILPIYSANNAAIADLASPDGNRYQAKIQVVSAFSPVVPKEDLTVPPTIIVASPPGDPYELSVGSIPLK